MRQITVPITRITAAGKVVTERMPLVSPYSLNKPTAGESRSLPNTQQEEPVGFHVNTQNAFLDVESLQAGKTSAGNLLKEVRAESRDACYTSRAAQIPVGCSECGVKLKNYFITCEDCCSHKYFCLKCCVKVHDDRMCQRNLFHKPKYWKVSF